MQQDQVKNILLVGKTGAGKSTLSNIMSGETQMFKESSDLKSETKICQSFQCNLFGNPNLPTIQICDTPGFMDSSGSDGGTIETIFDLLDRMDDNGIHLIIFCLSATEIRCDKSVLDTLKMLIQLMGDSVQGSMFVVITQINKINQQEIDSKCQQIQQQVPLIMNEAGIQINYDPMFFYYHGAKVNGLERLSELLSTKQSFRPEIADDYKRLYDPQDKDGSIQKIMEQNKQLVNLLNQLQEEKQKRELREEQQEQFMKLLQQQLETDRILREEDKLKMEQLEKKLAQYLQQDSGEIEEERKKMLKEIAETKEQRRKKKIVDKQELKVLYDQKYDKLLKDLEEAKTQRNQQNSQDSCQLI